MKLGIIIGSTRPGRNTEKVASAILTCFQDRFDAKIIDIADYNLPFLDEPRPAAYGIYTKEHTKRWSECIASFDAFIFVTPEYNQSIPGVLKNAIDFLAAEWKDKPFGIVSFGGGGGKKAAQHLSFILITGLKMKQIGEPLSFSLKDEFINYSEFNPIPEKIPNFLQTFAQEVGCC
jgi:NAD(P)H-dependent FMN reductase